jgi:hypothetical protein
LTTTCTCERTYFFILCWCSKEDIQN